MRSYRLRRGPLARAASGASAAPNVHFWARSPGGIWEPAAETHNTMTTYGLSSLAQWWAGASNVTGSPDAVLPPSYVSLGTGQGTPSVSDQYMFAEGYGTRIVCTFGDIVSTTTGLLAAIYGTTQAVGTWWEVGLWDGPTLSAAVGSAGVSSGATTLPLAADAPAVSGGSTPGQSATAYIDDSVTTPEYIAIATSAAAGASSWTLQDALQYDHAADTPIVVFGGNFWAHAALATPGATNPGGASAVQLLCQWLCPMTAVGP